MPTRRINSSLVQVTGTAPVCQLFESTNVKDVITILRFNRLAGGFEHRPVTLEWRDVTGKIQKHTADVLMRHRTGLLEATSRAVFCDAKPVLNTEMKLPWRRQPHKEDEEENALKWAAAEYYVMRQGWQFKVCRKIEIRAPYFGGVRRKYELARHEISALLAQAA